MRLWLAWFAIIGAAFAASIVGGLIGGWTAADRLREIREQNRARGKLGSEHERRR